MWLHALQFVVVTVTQHVWGGEGERARGRQDAALTMKSGPNKFISTSLTQQTELNLV